ncbi:hypothetical protein EDB85DRAFT_2141940 [Lactarius pseudohatsudake]|nr:hypothetical protein EDB85DRAFT_2141940 [Lactarius pseudohatsudake]
MRHRKPQKTSEKQTVPRKLDFVRVGGWYRVGKFLGSGGSGSVYLGKDIRTAAEVALKIGHADHSPSRLTYEYDVYKATAGCTGISPVCWYGKEGPYEVIVLEHVGTSLGDLHTAQLLSLRKTFLYAPQMLSAVESLHTRHYIHCDIKPGNFMVQPDHLTIFLIDFGLARLFRNPATYLHIPYSTDHSIVGTLPFTSINGQILSQDSSPEPEPVPRYPFPAPPQPPNLSREARGVAFWLTTTNTGTGYHIRLDPNNEQVYRLIFADLQWHGSQNINSRWFASSSIPNNVGLPSYEQLQTLENEGHLLEQPNLHQQIPPETAPIEPPQITIAAPVIPVTITSTVPPVAPPTSAPVPPTPTPMATPTTSGGLRSLPPAVFTSERSKSDQFLRDFRRFKILNRTNDIMSNPYNRIMHALSYMRGSNIDNWVDKQDRDLELVINSTDPTIHKDDTDEKLWDAFEKGFSEACQWKDRTKVQNAYEQLMKLDMKTFDIDTYIATFKRLAAAAEWEPDAKGTITRFKSGLHPDIHRRVLWREKWPTTMDGWKEKSREEVERMREIRSSFGPRHPNPSQGQYQFNRGNNNQTQRTQHNSGVVPMDVDAANKLAAEGRYFRCRLKGHMARECPQKNMQGGNAPRQNISAHAAEVEPATSEPAQQLNAIAMTMTDEEYGAWLDSHDMGEDFYSAEL